MTAQSPTGLLATVVAARVTRVSQVLVQRGLFMMYRPQVVLRSKRSSASPIFTPTPLITQRYNACITALARCSRWRQALAVLDGMRRAAADADRQREATDGKYRSSSVADGGGGSSGGAGVGERYGVVRPDVVSYSAAITACGNGGQRSRALALLEEMRADGVPPNVRHGSYHSSGRNIIVFL